MDSAIKACVLALQADRVRIALSDKAIFRRDIDPSYKAHRKKTRKPIGLPSLREHLLVHWRGLIVPELEADDVLGIWATDPMYEVGNRKIIVSTDKDMKTIPGELWNPDHPEFGVKNISRESADSFHLTQTLIGDTADGYPGCPTVGPTTAARILEPKWDGLDKEGNTLLLSDWDKVVAAYEKQNLSEDYALVQARLARILRVENYNMRNGKLKYWNP